MFNVIRLQDELFTNVWSRCNQLIKVDPLQLDSVILSAAHIARGNCSITDLKRNIERYIILFQERCRCYHSVIFYLSSVSLMCEQQHLHL